MPFSGDTFSHLFDWEKDPQRQEKIINARLEAEFDGVDTGLSAVAARVTTLESGGGNVTAASTFGNDNRIIRSDGTGRGAQSSGVTLDDSNNVSGAASYSAYVDDSGPGLLFKAEQDGVGDAAFTALLTGGVQWTWGIDNSASDAWKLSNSGGLGTSDLITVTTGGSFGLGSNNPTVAGTVVQTKVLEVKGQLKAVQGGNGDSDGCYTVGPFGFLSGNNWGGYCIVGFNLATHSTGATDQWRVPWTSSGYCALEFSGSTVRFLRQGGGVTAGTDVTPTVVGQFLDGFVWGSPTGGNRGAGTINAQAVYDDNTLLTCYVFDAAIDGAVEFAKWDAKVANYTEDVTEETIEDVLENGKPVLDNKGELVRRPIRTVVVDKATGKPVKRLVAERNHEPLRKFAARLGTEYDPLDIDAYTKHWREKRHLTSMPNMDNFDPEVGTPTGALVQRLWETVEIQAVHIAKLNDRLKQLESQA